MQKAVGYVRVSTDGQAIDGISLDAQRAKIEAWCVVNDYHLAEVFVDAGISGSRADNRPGLQAAIGKACESKAAMVVYSLSRLARSTQDTISIGEKLSKAGADLVSLSERIDTTSAAGKMVFRMLAVMAEFERDQISERTQMALAHKARKGERIGTVPYGWAVDTDGVKLIEVPSEQEVIGRIVDFRRSGLSYRAIAAKLSSAHTPTKNGAGSWSHTSVRSIACKAASAN